MSRAGTIAWAALAALAVLAAGQGAQARNRVRPAGATAVGAVAAGVNQHNTVMNNIYQAQQQNNAVINQVQNNIRANQPRP